MSEQPPSPPKPERPPQPVHAAPFGPPAQGGAFQFGVQVVNQVQAAVQPFGLPPPEVLKRFEDFGVKGAPERFMRMLERQHETDEAAQRVQIDAQAANNEAVRANIRFNDRNQDLAAGQQSAADKADSRRHVERMAGMILAFLCLLTLFIVGGILIMRDKQIGGFAMVITALAGIWYVWRSQGSEKSKP